MFGKPLSTVGVGGYGTAQNQGYGNMGYGTTMAVGQKLPNNFDSYGNGLTEYYITRLAPQIMYYNSVSAGGFGMGMQTNAFAPTTGFGTNTGATGFGAAGNTFGAPQFGYYSGTFTNAPAFGAGNAFGAQNAFSTNTGLGFGGYNQVNIGVNSTAQLDALTQSLDASKLLRTGKLLESIRSDLGVSMIQNTIAPYAAQYAIKPQEKAALPYTQHLLDSLHYAIAAQKQNEVQPKFKDLIDYSQVYNVQSSAFRADFDVTNPPQYFSQIGYYYLEINEPTVNFINYHAPVSKKYVTMPSIYQLSMYTDQMLERVQNFAVHCYRAGKLIGSIRFLYPVNLIGVDLDSVINIDSKCCNLQFTYYTAYYLNTPAEITLYDVFCPEGISRADYHYTIYNITTYNNGRLIEWNAEQGVWRFSVNSFIG